MAARPHEKSLPLAFNIQDMIQTQLRSTERAVNFARLRGKLPKLSVMPQTSRLLDPFRFPPLAAAVRVIRIALNSQPQPQPHRIENRNRGPMPYYEEWGTNLETQSEIRPARKRKRKYQQPTPKETVELFAV